jgi:Rod binding domain-containing protein
MSVILPSASVLNTAAIAPAPQPTLNGKDKAELRQAFDSFVGETFFGQMIKEMRKSVGKSAYFNGGRAEEIYQEQLDQALAKNISHASADQFTGPMFELFTMQRK